MQNFRAGFHLPECLPGLERPLPFLTEEQRLDVERFIDLFDAPEPAPEPQGGSSINAS